MLILVEEVKCRRRIKRYLRTLLTELSGWNEKRNKKRRKRGTERDYKS